MTMVSPDVFAPAERDALIRFRHVYKVYRIADTGVVALGGVDFDIPQGEFLAVVGPSGAGKSTILNLVGGLDRASAGEVDVDGQDLGLLDDDALTHVPGRARRVRLAGHRAQPGAVPHRARERAAARHRAPQRRALAAARRRGAAGPGRAARPIASTGRACSRAASSSASRSPWRWRTRPRSCWPTSPRPSSTPRVRPGCWRRSAR